MYMYIVSGEILVIVLYARRLCVMHIRDVVHEDQVLGLLFALANVLSCLSEMVISNAVLVITLTLPFFLIKHIMLVLPIKKGKRMVVWMNVCL